MRIPGRLPVVVRVDIHEAGGDDLAGSVYLSFRRACQTGTHGGDYPIHDGHVPSKGRGPAAVVDVTVANYQVEVCHGDPLDCRYSVSLANKTSRGTRWHRLPHAAARPLRTSSAVSPGSRPMKSR